MKRIARHRRIAGERRQMMHGGDQPIDGCVTIERWAEPRAREIARFSQRTPGTAKAVDRPVAGEAGVLTRAGCGKSGAAAQRAADALGRILQHLLNPAAKRPRVEAIGLRLGEYGEQRVDAGFDRALAEQLGAASVK